MNILTVK